jgi:hypothetical protein
VASVEFVISVVVLVFIFIVVFVVIGRVSVVVGSSARTPGWEGSPGYWTF